MDFVDWRKAATENKVEAEITRSNVGKLRSGAYHDYIEEIILKAQERGEFDNLPGTGKPLDLEDDSLAGDKALAYHLLKSNDVAPAEIELAKEIHTQRELSDAKLAKLVHRGKTLRARRIAPFASEKRAYNTSVQKAIAEYEETLRDLNRKILNLNLSTPAPMHQPFLDVEHLLAKFREACPLFEEKAQ